MHVMVATDGTLDAVKTAGLAAKLAADDGRVTVFTVVEVPRKLLEDMRDASLPPNDPKLSEVTTEYRDNQAETTATTGWIGDDAFVDRYVSDKVEDRAGDLSAALSTTGIDYEVIGEENEDAAKAILDAAAAREVDVLLIGPHGLGRFEGLLGSISTKLVRRASCSVMVVRDNR
jgi:nucleotide-binding universal stress UspA family protein